MSKHRESNDSFDEFFSASKTQSDVDKKKSKHNDIPPSSIVAALIRDQPIIHPYQTSSETKLNVDSKKTSMTTNGHNKTSKSKPFDSPHSKVYESDFDDETNRDGRKKYSSVPPSKQRSYETSRRGSGSELKASYTIVSDGSPRRGQFLPYVRPKNRRKGFTKPSPPKETKTEAEQRLTSAQNEKINALRSRLSEVRRQLEQERYENQTLRIVQRREEKSLKNYEDKESNVQKIAQEYKQEIDYVKEKISNERETKTKLEKEVEEQDETLRDQTKRMKFYEKLVTHEQDYEEYDKLRERLKETDKQLKKFEEKIAKQQKYIENLEQNYRQEINQELTKRRDLKHDLDAESKKYTNLFLKYEQKSRQVDTMHIYIQRGGRRPSESSTENLAKSRAFESVQDTSPQFRDKMLEYDKKRREEEKEKPKPPPRPILPPPKPERKVYVPSIDLKPKPKFKPLPQITKSSPEPIHVVEEEKPPIIVHVPVKSPVRRLSTPKSYDEDNSELEEDIIIEPAHTKPRSPSPPPRRISVPSSVESSPTPPPPPLSKLTEPPPPVKPTVTRDFDDKWMNLFTADKKEESTKEDLLSKLTSDEPREKKSTPSTSQRPTMNMLESQSNQKKVPPRVVTSVYDFEQAVINLHEGKPVTTQPTTNRASVDIFASSSGNMNTKPSNHLHDRDESFTKTQAKPNTFESIFGPSTTEAGTSTITKANSKQTLSPNDKLQRPKIVTNAPKSTPNRTVSEEIEDFYL